MRIYSISALAFGAAAVRWPRLGWIALCALAGGACYGIDWRGFGITLAALGLCLVAIVSRPDVRRRALPWVVLALGIGAGPVINKAYLPPGQMEAAHQVGFHRAQLLDLGNNPIFHTGACSTFDWSADLSVAALVHPCARTLAMFNADRVGPLLPFTISLSLACLGLAMLPRGRDWRSTVASLLCLGTPAAMLLGMCLLLPMTARYLLYYAAPIAMVVPVGVERLAAFLVPRYRSWLALLCAAPLLGILADRHEAGSGPEEIPLENHQQFRLTGEMMLAIREQVDPERDWLVDCSQLQLELGALPVTYQTLNTRAPTAYCHRLMEAGEQPSVPGVVWVVTGGHGPSADLRSLGWSLATTVAVDLCPDGECALRLWRYPGL